MYPVAACAPKAATRGAAAAPGVAEETEVTCVNDVAGSLHDTNFRIYRSNGGGGEEQVAVVMDCGARAEVARINFTALSGTDFVTGSSGKYVQFDGFYIWFATGTETDPAGTGTGYGVSLQTTDSASDIVQNVLLQIFIPWSTAADGEAVNLTAPTTGPKTNAVDVNTGASVTTTTQGRDAAGAVGGVTSIIVDISDNDNATTIGSAIEAACDGNGWAVSFASGTGTFTDSATGARTDASDVSTGFTISVAQQGS